jgi:carbon monoxide dehydrogenase subunit G
MARFTTDIDVALPAAEVFAYLADFSNAQDWDPGVATAVRLDDGPVTVGSRFALDLAVGSSTQRWTYVTEVHEVPTRVRFATSGRFAEGADDIGVVARGDGACTIEWDARFGFTGLGRLIDPLFQLAFNRIAGKAVDGLRRKMRELESAAA